MRPFSGSRSTEILQRGAELLKLAASLLIFRPHRPVVAAAVAVVVVVVVVIIIVVPIRKQAPRRSSYDSAQHPPPADDSFTLFPCPLLSFSSNLSVFLWILVLVVIANATAVSVGVANAVFGCCFVCGVSLRLSFGGRLLLFFRDV